MLNGGDRLVNRLAIRIGALIVRGDESDLVEAIKLDDLCLTRSGETPGNVVISVDRIPDRRSLI